MRYKSIIPICCFFTIILTIGKAQAWLTYTNFPAPAGGSGRFTPPAGAPGVMPYTYDAAGAPAALAGAAGAAIVAAAHTTWNNDPGSLVAFAQALGNCACTGPGALGDGVNCVAWNATGAGSVAGSVVAAGDADVGTALVGFGGAERHADPNGNGTYEAGEGIYNDADGSGTVSPGDTRLGVPGFRARSVVGVGDGDVGTALIAFVAAERNADPNGNGTYDEGERIYNDADGSGTVSAGDTRVGDNALASTLVRSVAPGTLTEFDMCIYPGITEDLQSVVLHEFGHALGLDHPDASIDLPQVALNGQRPFVDYTKVVMRASDPSGFIKRTLVCDDKAGANFLYPPMGGVMLEPRSYVQGNSGGCDFGDAPDPFVATIGQYPSLENGEDSINNGILDRDIDNPPLGNFSNIEDVDWNFNDVIDFTEDINADMILTRGNGARHKDSRMEWLGPVAAAAGLVNLPPLFGQAATFIPKNPVLPAPPNGFNLPFPGSVVAGQTLDPGSVVAAGNADVGTALVGFGGAERHADPNGDGMYDAGEGIYDDADLSGTVSAGDTRLAVPGHAAGSVVAAMDDDVGRALVAFVAAERHADPNGDGMYDAGEGIYNDADGSGTVSAGDTRLDAATPASATFETDARLANLDELDDGVSFRGPIIPGVPVVVDVLVNTNGLAPGRYNPLVVANRLYLNGWEDWNGDGDWKDWLPPVAGGVVFIGAGGVPPCMAPAASDEYVLHWQGSPAVDQFASPNFCRGTAVGLNARILTFVVTPPPIVATTFFGRFRLDYGEHVGQNFTNFSDSTLSPGRALDPNSAADRALGIGFDQGEAAYGEVEDYQQALLPTPRPRPQRPPQPEALPPPPRAELIINKECHRQTVRVGDQLIYRLSVRNLGPSDATDVVITDTLPENVEFVTAPACLLSGSTVTCNIGNLRDGAKETREITVRPTAPGRLRNTATVTANEPDRHLANNTATVVCRAEELLIPTRPAR